MSDNTPQAQSTQTSPSTQTTQNVQNTQVTQPAETASATHASRVHTPRQAASAQHTQKTHRTQQAHRVAAEKSHRTAAVIAGLGLVAVCAFGATQAPYIASWLGWGSSQNPAATQTGESTTNAQADTTAKPNTTNTTSTTNSGSGGPQEIEVDGFDPSDNPAFRKIDPTSINQSDIVRVVAHGDHYHVFLKSGEELITYSDPRVSGVSALSNAHAVISGAQAEAAIANKQIVRVYRHGDHYHVITADGKEYITYTNPFTGKQVTGANSGSAHGTHAAHAGADDATYAGTGNTEDAAHVGTTSGDDIEELDVTGHATFDPSTAEATTLHFHGYSDKFIAGTTAELWAHTLNDQVASYHWTLIDASGKSYDLQETGDRLSLPLKLVLDGSTISVAALDANGNSLETLSKPLHVVKLGDVAIRHLEDHYHTGGTGTVSALSSNPDVDRFVWTLTGTDGSVIKTAEGKSFSFTAHKGVGGARLTVEAFVGEKSIGSASATITINDHGAAVSDVYSQAGYADTVAALTSMGLDERVINGIIAGKDNPAFPSGETDTTKLRAWLATVKTLSFTRVDDPFALAGLETLTGLENFYSYKAGISADNMAKLESLPFAKQIKSLHISDAGLSDLSFIAKYTTLENINVSGNTANDISYVQNLSHLKEFYATFMGIQDITPLAGKQLTKLSLMGNLVSDISVLKDMPLTDLSLVNNSITDISVLSTLKHLQAVDLSNLQDPELYEGLIGSNKISNLSAFDGNTTLTGLFAQDLHLSELGWTTTLPQLKELLLLQNNLAALPLNLLPSINKLDASNNQITSLATTNKLEHLEELYMSYNKLTSLQGLENMPSLQLGHFDHNQVSTIALTSPNYSVNNLNLEHNKISSLEGLDAWKSLSEINVSHNDITSLDNATSDSLTAITASSNEITSLGDLNGISHLNDLLLNDNKLTDISGIQSNSLANLDLSNWEYTDDHANNLTSVKGIENLPNLETLVVSGNPITNINDTHSDSLTYYDATYDLSEDPDPEKYPNLKENHYVDYPEEDLINSNN